MIGLVTSLTLHHVLPQYLCYVLGVLDAIHCPFTTVRQCSILFESISSFFPCSQ